MPDLYAVFGHPVAHSKSPRIHAEFAAQTGQALHYEARLVPLPGFVDAVRQFVTEGGRGANVTVPFKEEAFRLCESPGNTLTPRARQAGAVNTLKFSPQGGILGDNTDGAGLVRDMETNLGFSLAGRRILLLGAGGAARGVLTPLLERQPSQLTIANRTAAKAKTLATAFAPLAACPLSGAGLEDLVGQAFDVLINATAASLENAALPLPAEIFAPGCLAYDLMYGKGETPFLRQARHTGAAHLADGLGMLVEQAAEAFLLWRGLRPDTHALLHRLRVEQTAG
ncbi:MAG: shikimate dehydrogenase [Zoogloeaceae bacterium]|jgi:shikimate dehydrogenase|nr:shikimate dehydrogenase [Zoogloeaceae bacterium]